MSFRVRFSQDRPDVAYVPPNPRSTLSADIFALPLPPLHQEMNFQIDIHTAASIGEANAIMELLARGFPVNKPNHAGWTALLYAAYLGHADTCTLLIDKGAEVDAANATGQTALMLASACGNMSVVKVLLASGANSTRTDNGGRQPLHYAASCSQNQIVDNLLNAGCDPNAKDSAGMTPVLEACQAAHELTLDSLMKKGGDPYWKNNRGEDGEALAAEAPKILEQIQNTRRKSLGGGGGGGGVVVEPSRSRDPQTLTELLEAMQLERYLPRFEMEHIDLKLFFSLTDKDLEDMGVAYGPKKRMRAVIDRYRNTGVVQVDLPLPSAPPPYSEIMSEGLNQLAVAPSGESKVARSILESTQLLAIEAVEGLGSDETSERLRPMLLSIKDGLTQALSLMQRN